MTIWGINIFDLLIVVIFLIILIWIGARTSKHNKNTQDFFLAGRKLNKMYQFFLNFGCSTHADQTVAVTREIYRQGIGGMWIQFLVLFLTPFYWFTTFFFRRVRLVTIGDFFAERFRSKFLGGGVGYIVAAKTVMAMTLKPLNECTVAEQKSMAEFKEFRTLLEIKKTGLSEEQNKRYIDLSEKNKKGELSSFVSYIRPIWFYLIFSIIDCIYTMMGGK